jgi:peptidoglycan/xylan/chitin deacetylase (PgdA/CDA1 family)
MSGTPAIAISFDVEEFDLPLEYRQALYMDEQLAVGMRGLDAIRPVLDDPRVRSTLFTTAFFAGHFKETIHDLAGRHEIASHSFHHSSFVKEDLLASRLALEAITGKPVTGLRMPRMRLVAPDLVAAAGYRYDSSLNPTWVPGRYDHRGASRLPVARKGIVEVPASVTPRWRIPLFWLAFKNLPYSVFLRMARRTLREDGHLALYFHPWEFTDLSAYKLPAYVTRGDGGGLLRKLRRLVYDLSGEGELMTMGEIAERWGKKLAPLESGAIQNTH